MTKHSGILTGTAGVYFVASQLAARDFHAAPTFGNAPSVDILVGLPDGAATLSIQVKTSRQAFRRATNKRPAHYEWDVGEKSANLNQRDLFFAFVDLKGASTELPDIFIIPSETIFKTFDKSYFKSGVKRRWRFHPTVETVAQFKNNWKILQEYLHTKAKSVTSLSDRDSA